jgi:hypothetical protein
VKSTFNVISDGSSLLDEHRNDAWLIDSESEWLKCKKGCFKMRPPNSSLEVQHTVSAAVILPVISECPHTVILQNWASWVSGGAYRLTRTDAPKYWRGTRRGAHPRDVASSPDLSHACTMLKRQGLHLRPLPKRRRTVVRQTSAAHRGQLAPSVAAWLAASGSARETFALEHFALAGEQPHHTCQVCQEAIRARLQRRSLLARQAAPEEDHAPPELVHLTPALAGSAQLADSSAWSPRSPPVSSTTPASFASPDATLSGGTPPRTYWTDVGRAAWEAYWELRSESASCGCSTHPATTRAFVDQRLPARETQRQLHNRW